MLTIFIMNMIIIMLPVIMALINFMISKKIKKNYEKMSPFECGFDPLSFNRLPFSVQFFLISIIFLIFDTEIILLIPLVTMTPFISTTMIMITLLFLFILIAGLYLEYLENSIEWKI